MARRRPGIMKNLYGELRKRGVYSFGKFNCVMVAPPLTRRRRRSKRAFARSTNR